MKEKNRYLLWLNWPVGCFRLDGKRLGTFREIVRGRGETVAVRSARAFLEELPLATHALCWHFKKEWFARAGRLKVLATPSAGRELLPADADVPDCVVKSHGGFHGPIMAETVVACIFAHARGVFQADAFQRAGENPWPRAAMSPFCSRVAGTKAVILGYGKIGRAAGAKLEALGVKVCGITRKNADTLADECRTADWLVCALPSDTGTDGIVSAAVLRALPRRAVLVNIGRGNAVDEDALARALRGRRLAAAFLDVFRDEPLASSSPLVRNPPPNLHRFPHMSAFAPDYLESFFRELNEKGLLS